MIIWGKKKVEKTLGFVADLCPICREIRPFMVFRLGMASHINYLSFNDGELAGHVAECQVCKTKIPVNSLKYKSLSNVIHDDLESLIAQTYPNLRNNYADRLMLTERIRNREVLSTVERDEMLLESFQHLSNRIEEQYAKVTFDRVSKIGCWTTVLLVILFSCITPIIITTDSAYDLTVVAAGLTALAGLIFTVLQLILAPGRFIRKEIVPLLARTIAPLNPTLSEIETMLEKFRIRGFKIGEKISKEKLWETLQKTKVIGL